ncbi:MAG: hypothetical protein A3H29_16565 [Acidobacteria bacterium RIFCSPLOWO2_02_FULL_67_21]|nr:MAG: hypothetical protein A3H29_16565 [Acidobacteria bacterium RIFCSPLOWO2_02_FULL_67_21]
MSETEEPGDEPRHKDRRPRDPDLWIHGSIKKHRHTDALHFRPDNDFFRLADPIVRSQRTLLGYDRLYVFWQAVRNVSDVPGSAAEIGSYRGGSAYFIAGAFVRRTGGEVPMHVFDTFEGHPQEAIGERDRFQEAGQFSATSYEDVRAYLSPFPSIRIHKGPVSASLAHLEEAAYRLVHIDTDLYEPTIDCLEYFGRRLSPGGVVVLDDYSSTKCPGVPQAAFEYLERANGFQVWDMRSGQLMLVKR